MASLRRRGVLMTATASKPKASWKEASPEKSGDEALEPALASQKEWAEIERQVRDEKRKLFARDNFAQGKRGKIDTYDDVASESEGSDESDDESTASNPRQASPKAPDAAENTPKNAENAGAEGSIDFDAEALRVAQAWARGPLASSSSDALAGAAAGVGGEEEKGSKRRRGGNRDTKKLNKAEKKRLKREAEAGDDDGDGAREGATGEDGEMTAGKKRRLLEKKDEEEAMKWLRTKLQGEEKPRRIRVNRVVYYYDHDSAGQLFPEKLPGVDASAPVEATAPETEGNFRASVRQDMFDDDSDEDL